MGSLENKLAHILVLHDREVSHHYREVRPFGANEGNWSQYHKNVKATQESTSKKIIELVGSVGFEPTKIPASKAGDFPGLSTSQ
jgi:hypothetical protein